MTQESAESLSVDRLFREASAQQRAGNLEQAIAGYAALLRQHPEHMRALNRLGNCLLSVGKLKEAALLFERAARLYPDSPASRFNLGRALALLDKAHEARQELTAAVKLKPDLAMAWLHLGALIEKENETDLALGCYQSAFDLSPKLEHMPGLQGIPPELAEKIRHALRVLRKKYIGLHRTEMQKLEQKHGADNLRRVQACVDGQHGVSDATPEHPLQKPESIYFPGLTASAWFARESFGWVAELERHWESIRDEFLALGGEKRGFRPYVGDGPGVPPEMQNLAGSHDWDAFHLLVGGALQENSAEACPVTARLLQELPLAELAGVSPEAFFSILRPGAHIKPHHGISNAKVAVHLPLIVPDNCAIRVGDQWKTWTEGECLIFDDSFEHEAYNRGQDVRVVLIFEVWHPDLNDIETEALTALSYCIDSWSSALKSDLLAKL